MGDPFYTLTNGTYAPFVQMVETASPDFNCSGTYCIANKTCSYYYELLQPLTFITTNKTNFTVPPEGYTISDSLMDGHSCSVAVRNTSADIGG